MPVTVNTGDWINRNGKPVPVRNIPKHIRRRDLTVTRIMKIAMKLQERMKSDKAKMHTLVNDYCKYVAKVKESSDLTPEGNLQLSDYANLNLVSLYQNSIIGFDEQLNVAKAIINKCMNKWSKGANANLRIIVDNAFKLDSKGNLNRSMIIGLTQIEINDKNWNKAMGLIKSSIFTKETKQYLKIAKRKTLQDKFEGVVLDMSTL
mgnify:FL=1